MPVAGALRRFVKVRGRELPATWLANVLGWLARMRAAEAEDCRGEADRSALSAQQQAALRRSSPAMSRLPRSIRLPSPNYVAG